MARYGISARGTLGVPIPVLRALARSIEKNHTLAAELWASEVHEARILAGMIDDPAAVAPEQMDAWARDFDSWDITDQCCANLFEDTPFAGEKAIEWSAAEAEYVKRAGFVLMARLAVSDRRSPDRRFLRFLPVIRRGAGDSRNFVKKAVNWALRQIGKRSVPLNRRAAALARALKASPAAHTRWIGADALRELTNPETLRRLARR
jgi:3-methyladenine DNA glycosylase AlkD